VSFADRNICSGQGYPSQIDHCGGDRQKLAVWSFTLEIRSGQVKTETGIRKQAKLVPSAVGLAGWLCIVCRAKDCFPAHGEQKG
jgi:hypothetical protein